MTMAEDQRTCFVHHIQAMESAQLSDSWHLDVHLSMKEDMEVLCGQSQDDGRCPNELPDITFLWG